MSIEILCLIQSITEGKTGKFSITGTRSDSNGQGVQIRIYDLDYNQLPLEGTQYSKDIVLQCWQPGGVIFLDSSFLHCKNKNLIYREDILVNPKNIELFSNTYKTNEDVFLRYIRSFISPNITELFGEISLIEEKNVSYVEYRKDEAVSSMGYIYFPKINIFRDISGFIRISFPLSKDEDIMINARVTSHQWLSSIYNSQRSPLGEYQHVLVLFELLRPIGPNEYHNEQRSYISCADIIELPDTWQLS
jgi:hypothetical protein